MEVLDAIEDDDGTRVLVLTGAGTRAFSSGADIACFAASVRRGQVVALRSSYAAGRLPRLIGRKRALRMILSAEPITASEAFACFQPLVGAIDREMPEKEPAARPNLRTRRRFWDYPAPIAR